MDSDVTPPVISGCPTADITVTVPVGATSGQASWVEPTATDNSQATPAVSRSHLPNSFFPVGTTSVTYTFTDGSGNADTCSFRVVVRAGEYFFVLMRVEGIGIA